MIEGIKICLTGDCAVSYDTVRGRECLPFSAILPYWDYAEAEEVEGVRVYRMEDGESLMVLFSVADGQGGAVLCWNTRTREITHISDAAFALAACLYEGRVYTLLQTGDYATPSRFVLERVSFGLKDMETEPEQAKELSVREPEGFGGDYADADLTVDDQGACLRLGERVFHCALQWPES